MRRFLAEWEKIEAVLLALPDKDTDWDYILPEALGQFFDIIEAISSREILCLVLCHDKKRAEESLVFSKPEFVRFVEVPYNDTWTRDYGPITIENHGEVRLLDFGFNGWGLKFAADKDNLVNLNLSQGKVYDSSLYRNNRDFELEGGSIETDGEGTLLTTTRCLTSPNRNGGKTKAELNEILSHRLGVDHILWLNYGALDGDDTDSHIDTLARMAPNNTILFTGCRDMDDPHFEELLKMRAQLTLFRNKHGEPYNLVELPLPSPVIDTDGSRLPATYANYLVANGYVFMPTYNQPENDRLACMTVRIAFPDHEVVPVPCVTLTRQHGSLHCSTMQLYPGTLILNT